MTVFLVGYKPATDPTNSLANTTRQYTSKVSAGDYGNTIPFAQQVFAGYRITRAWFFIRAASPPTAGNVTMAPYLTNAAGVTQGARIDPGWTITTTSATGAWHSIDLNIDLTAQAGQYIKPSGGYGGGARIFYATCTAGHSGSIDADRPNPFGTAVDRANLMAMYLEVTSPENITSVNGGNPVKLGSNFSYSHSGFSSNPNAAKLDGIDLTGVTTSEANAPALVDGQVVPKMGGRPFSVSSGSQTALINVSIEPPVGNYYQTLAGTLDAGNYSWIPPGAGAQVGDFIVFQTEIAGIPTGTEIDPDGKGRTNVEGEQILWLIKATTGLASSYKVITGPGGEVVEINRFIQSSKITARTIKSKFIEAKYF